jgi:arylsulfatase A-like enzyme/Flp pilus assembly protein TadD
VARPFRHTFILVLAALGMGLAAAGGWRYARASAPVNGPIILISIDTLRADHLPVYGYRKVKTPAIDALAADGTVFERAYSHAPQTLPAHTALLSGRLPFETGVRDDIGFVVKSGERLLPQMLRERGYATAGIVSSYVLRKETGINQGFDFFDMPASSREPTIERVQQDGSERDGGESEAIAERWLDQQRSQRVFLFLHLYEPHAPYSPPAQYGEYEPYDGEIAYADEIVGRLIRYLKSHQLYDRSTIVLLSDHGEGLGDHGEQEHGLFVYEEALHVPLIVKQAGGTGGGRRIGDLVQHIDVVPTILDLAKAPIPGNLRGQSLKPVLEGTSDIPERTVYSEALYGRYHFGWSELTALTDARYRYIKAPEEELYDLDRDPHERQNIADDRARSQTHDALRGALDRLVAGVVIDAPSEASAEDRDRSQVPSYAGTQTDVIKAPGETLPDPKEKREILGTYREALQLAADRQWRQAIRLLQQVLHEDPGVVEVWGQLATFAIRIERYDQAVDAYQHIIELKGSDPKAYIGAATTLLKLRRLDEARAQAELAASVAVETDVRSRASAHELLAKIALARREVEAAREEADLAKKADPTLPLPIFIEARILYDQGNYDEALPLFQQTIAELNRSHGLQIADLHFYAGDTLDRLERYPESESQFIEELKYFPQNTRASAALAMLYQSSGRSDAASKVLADMVETTPTPDAFAQAARVWTLFGNRQQANALRAQARRTFADPPAGRHVSARASGAVAK